MNENLVYHKVQIINESKELKLGYISKVEREPIIIMMGDISKILIYRIKSDKWINEELSFFTFYINQSW